MQTQKAPVRGSRRGEEVHCTLNRLQLKKGPLWVQKLSLAEAMSCS